MKSKLLYIACLCFVFGIGGCVDENIAPSLGNVTVHLFDINNFPGNLEARVSFGDNRILFPDHKGIVNTNIPVYPYSLSITYPILEIWQTCYTVYDKTNCKDVFIIPPNIGDNYSINQIIVNIQFPQIQYLKRGLIKFISKDLFIDKTPIELHGNQTVKAYAVYIPSDKFSISGKFIILEYKIDTLSGELTSFENYGEKDVNLRVSNNPDIVFSNDDLAYNPDESQITCAVKCPRNEPNDSYISLNFDTYNSNSDLLLFDFYPNYISKSYIVPGHLPMGFHLRLYNSFSLDNFLGLEQFKWMIFSQGSNIVLDNTNRPVLQTPADNDHLLSDTSTFRFASDPNPGIFNIQFYIYGLNDIPAKSFVTEKNFVSYSELKNKGISFSPGSIVAWWVEKYSEFSSIDDFLSKPYTLNPNYSSKTVSDMRTFRLAP